MSKPTIALAYCIDNINVAEEIDNRISSSSPYRFEHFYCKKTTAEASIGEQLGTYNGPILLLVSDNFLKSAQCMSKGLSFLQKKGSDILPIVVSGYTKNDDTGELEPVPTEFERVSDIIQYINYWQDQYLDLRRQKRQVKGLDEEKFNTHLKVMREISSEAGEFLRLLRNQDYVSYEEFATNSFEKFFQFVEDLNAWHSFKDATQGASISTQEPQPVAMKTEEEPVEEVDLTDIPGIDLLKEQPETAEEAPQAAGSPEESATPETSSDIPFEISNEEEEPPAKKESETEEEAVSIALEEESAAEEEEEEEETVEEESAAEEEEEEEEEDLEVILEKAMQYANADQTEKSLELLAEAVTAHPENTNLRYHYALLLAQQEDKLNESANQLRALLDIEPDNANANYLMGEVAELREDFETARHHYEKVAAHAPKHPDIFYRLGMVIANHFPDDAEKAAAHFQKALEYEPDNVDARYQHAMLFSETLGDTEKAAKLFNQVLEKQPDHPFAHYDLALLYYRTGEMGKAKEFYMKAVENNPELRTEENDIAFGIKGTEAAASEPVTEEAEMTGGQGEEEEKVVEKKALVSSPAEMSGQEETESSAPAESDDSEDDPIAALRKNISRLESMLKEQKSAPRAPVRKEGEGRIVMITGATSGIGRATAKEFAENGYRLILTGRREERLARLKNIFEELFDAEVKTLCFDVRDIDAIKKVFSEELDFEWRQIDLLINNAGKAKGLDPIQSGKIEHWEEMIDTNLKGLLYMTRAVLPNMVKRRTGHVINVASTAGKEVYPNGNVYCATKFAVDALTKAMRQDLVDYNIRVSQVSPGHVAQTEFAKVRFDGDEEKAKGVYENFVPLNARDVAEAIYFIASRPRHVNVQDVVMMGTQQAGSTKISRQGREVINSFIERIRMHTEE